MAAFTCPAGTNAQIDPVTGNVLYCYDDSDNVSYPPSDPTQPVAPGAPLGGGSSAGSSALSVFSGITSDFLTAWRTVTTPQLAPGTVGVSGTIAPGGVALSGSPLLLLGLLAIVYLVVRK